jgi:branched-chain amino acid transport system substrate-binding protein
LDRAAGQEREQDPLVAGQWQRHAGAFELVITANKPAPEIPVGGTLELLS